MSDTKGPIPPDSGAEKNRTVVYDIDDILAQYGRQAEESRPEEGEETPPPEPALQPDNLLDDISPEALFDLPPKEEGEFEEYLPPEETEEADPSREEAEAESPEREAPSDGAAPEEDKIPLSMEDVVACTVDAVQGEQETKRKKFLKKARKAQKKGEDHSGVRRRMKRSLPEIGEEPEAEKTAALHKRRFYDSHRSFLLSLPVLLLLWAPWVLTQVGIQVPFFGESLRNQGLCVVLPQMVLLLLCGPLFREIRDGFRKKTCSMYLMAVAAMVVTLADGVALTLLPERTAAAPLGGVASLAAVFSLWGSARYHRGMWETFRIAAMGEPTFGVDCCPQGAAKGVSTLWGFHTRATMPDRSTGLQRLLTPLLLLASVAFAGLSSFGQGRPQDLLLNWSVVLCASTSLCFPLAFAVPFGRLALRLARNGAAVAGQYGAEALAAARRIVVTDGDLFPQGTVDLNGLKLYAEERDHAIAYAATLEAEAGGCLGRCFEDMCRASRIPLEPLEHFHIHDEDGLSGMIHGETVLVGSPMFMRHRAVRLPKSLPGKTPLCLAVDGELRAIFAVKYDVSEPVEGAVRALGRNGLQLALAVRDGSISPRLLKSRFGSDGGAVVLEREYRLGLSDPEYEVEAPNGLLYREGLAPYVDLVTGARRLCTLEHTANILAAVGSIFGALVAFYLAAHGSFAVLTPLLLVTYALLWVVPLLPLLWGVDKT